MPPRIIKVTESALYTNGMPAKQKLHGALMKCLQMPG